MNAAAPLSDADPPLAGGAVPAGRRLLGLVQRMMQTGLAMARCVNRIARQRLAGQDLARLAPAKFNATSAYNLVLEAVSLTAALRERLLALAGPQAQRLAPAPGLPEAERTPHARMATADLLPEVAVEAAEGDWHNWRDLARPWRMGSGGVAIAARAIAELSDREVVALICANLQLAAKELGADADVERIAALEAAARALCPDAAAATGSGAAGGGKADDAPAARAAEPSSDPPEARTGHDPPPDED